VIPDLDLGPYGGQQLGVSRKHAYLVQTETGLSVRDLGSTNGTLVNGRILAANQEWSLRDGDEVRLGKLALNIYFITESSPPAGPE
jgi:pSer/pThr/pTyr-binding forkhead associated (FHA) protein